MAVPTGPYSDRMRILVTGGARSGKSRHAVRLLDDSGAATFIAPGRPADEFDDPDWAARVAHHQRTRPAAWHTIESADVAGALADVAAVGAGADAQAPGPVIVDCLGSWLTAAVDELGLWDAPMDEARAAIDEKADVLCAALALHEDVVLVTNEVGSGVVPAHRSGGIFRDLLGALNQSVAEVCHEVHLVVCGRVMRL